MLRICAGQFKGRLLKLPPESISRPSSNRLRQAIFNILTNLTSFENLIILDAFAGSGALGLESLSRGAAKVVFCEKSMHVQYVLRQNILNMKELEENQVTVTADLFHLDVWEPFNLVFLDPPYDQHLEVKALQHLVNKSLIAPNAFIVIEQRKGAKIPEIQDFMIHLTRTYGNCQVTILRYKN